VAGHEVVDRTAVWLPHLAIEQGGGADHDQAPRRRQGGGQRLVDQLAQAAVLHRAGL
jgi:hypothetical protein